MKRFYVFSFLFAIMLVTSNMMYASLDKDTTQTSSIDYADVCIDSNGNVYHMVFNGALSQFIITKADEYGALDDQFGTNGVVTLTLVSDSGNGASGSNINVNNFSSITSAFMRLDSTRKPVLAFMADRSSGNNVIVAVRLDATTGAFDTTFDNDGFGLTVMTAPTITEITDLAIDSSRRIIVCGRYSSGRPFILRYAANGADLPKTRTIPSASLSDEIKGSKLVVDESNNVYVVGKHGASSGSYGMFCLKLDESDLSLNSSFASGSNNVYSTGNIGLDSNSTVFPAMFDSEDASAFVKVFGLRAGGQSLAVYNVRLSDGALVSNTNSANIFPSSATVKGFVPISNSKAYLAGTINSGGETPFVARLASDLSGDTTFIASGHGSYIADGVAKIDVTTGATFNSGDGGWLAYSATSPDASVAIGFKETSGGNLQFVRVFGLEDATFLKTPIPPIAPSVSKSVVAAAAAGKARKDQSFSHLAISGTNITSIDDGGVMVTGYDDVVSFFRDGSQFVFTVMDEQGELETNFTSTGNVKIALKSTGGDSTNVAITNFSQVTENQMSYMASDQMGNIYLAVQVDINGGNKQVAIFKVKNGVGSGNGVVDTTFGTSGVATLTASSDTEQLECLLIDSQGRIIIVMHHDNTTNTTAQVYRLTSAGAIDSSFASGKADLRTGSFLTDAQTGLTAQLDHQDNVYIGGQYSSGGDRGFFCAKLKSSDGSIDTTEFATGGTAGLFKTANFSEFDGNNMQTYISIYEYDDIQNIQLVSRGTSSTIVMQRIDFAGTTDDTFGSSGKVVSTITGLNSVGNVLRSEEGYTFVGGTLTDGTLKTFLARYSNDSVGAIDTDFGDENSGSKTGIAQLEPTDGWTVQNGGFFFIDSGSAAPVLFIEQNGANRRLIVERIHGGDDFDFDLSTVDPGDNLEGFIQANHFNDKDRLWAYIDIDRVLETLQETWEAVGSPLTADVIATGILLFKDAMNIVLQYAVNRATSNSYGSVLALPNKTGIMQKKMQQLMNRVDNSFTEAQLNAMDAGVNAAFEKVFSRLNGGRQSLTGNQRKKQKTV